MTLRDSNDNEKERQCPETPETRSKGLRRHFQERSPTDVLYDDFSDVYLGHKTLSVPPRVPDFVQEVWDLVAPVHDDPV